MLFSSDGQAFTFNSVYLTGAWNNGLNIQISGLLGGVQQYFTIVVVDSTAPTLFSFNWADIDELRFASFGGTDAGSPGTGEHFALDNFTYDAQAIPTPALLPGLIGMGVAVLRKRKGEAAEESSEA